MYYPLEINGYCFSIEILPELLIDNGVKNFKLEGRDNDTFCFLRDVGDYIFNNQYFSRIAHSIMGEAI